MTHRSTLEAIFLLFLKEIDMYFLETSCPYIFIFVPVPSIPSTDNIQEFPKGNDRE